MSAAAADSAPDSALRPRAPSAAWSAVWRVAKVALRVLVPVAIAAALVYTAVRQWHDVRDTFLRLPWWLVALSLLAATAGIAANMLSWRSVAAELGHPVPVGVAARICFVGQLAKYMPGSVWAYVMQMELARRAGIPRDRAFLASVIGTGLTTTAGLLVGTAGLPALFDAARTSPSGRLGLYMLVGLVPIALLCAHPAVLTRLVGVFLRLLRREPLRWPLRWGGVARSVGWSALAWLCFGVHLWLLTIAVVPAGRAGLVSTVGAMTLGMIAGMFAVISPSGLGVREAVVVAALLSATGDAGVALGIALASRLVFTAADVLAAGAALPRRRG